MLLLGLKVPTGPKKYPLQQFIIVNTHLLFPHNEYSTKIRLRQANKILGFVESYRQSELCTSICGRSDVKIPVIVCGDFNGRCLFFYLKT
jgi:endonuclease/exonuclease/phosphatase family metal-dependent hydrolase